MVRLTDPRVWKSLGGALAGGAVAGLLFDAPAPVDDITRRLERIGYEDITINRVGDSFSVDFRWPNYPQLTMREVGSSIIVTDTGAFQSMTYRFPGFDTDEYNRGYAMSLAERAAEAGGLDVEEDTRLNTWAPFYAPHVHAQRRDYPQMTTGDALGVVKHGKDLLDDELEVTTGR